MNEAIAQYGLEIDEFRVKNPGDFVSFLDIKYAFDEDGNIQTDLHVKETATQDPICTLAAVILTTSSLESCTPSVFASEE